MGYGKKLAKDLLTGREDPEYIYYRLNYRNSFQFFEEIMNSINILKNPQFRPLLINVLYHLFECQKQMRKEYQETLDLSIINMILNARGRINWRISSMEDLETVLELFQELGFNVGSTECYRKLILSRYKIRFAFGERRYRIYYQKVFGENVPCKIPKLILFDAEVFTSAWHYGIYLEEVIPWFNETVWDEAKKIRRQIDRECKICARQEELEIHHVIPKSRGGLNFLENLITLCTKCHKEVHLGWDMGFSNCSDVQELEL